MTAPSCNLVPPGAWVDAKRRAPCAEAISRLASHRVVLLGEQHDRMAHHEWQRDTIAALHACRSGIVIGFEMFPRRAQTALDRWPAGDLDEAQFLAAADWEQVWGMDAALYRPLFAFAREHRLPMRALNVDRATARRVAAQGFAAVPIGEREGVGEPAPASPAYRARLAEVFKMHPAMSADPDRFERFVRGQQVWDRAMAEAIATALTERADALVVGIMGRGHIEHGDGVPHQLAALGVGEVATALPWPADTDYPHGIADLLFGMTAQA